MSPPRAERTAPGPGGRRTDPLLAALWAATLIWVVGMCTVFPLGNEALESVSIFTFDRIAFLIVAPLFGLAIARDPGILRQIERVDVLLGLFLALAAVSWLTTLSGKPAVALKRDVNLFLTNLLMPAVAFLIARHVRWSRRQVRVGLWATIAGVGAFLVALGLVQGLVDWRFMLTQAALDTHPHRARGPFQNAAPYAVALGLLVPAAIALRVHEPRRAGRLALALLVAGLLEALLLSKLRIVWLAVPAAALFLAWRCPPARRAATLAGVTMLALVGLAAVGIDLRAISPAARVPEGNAAVFQRLIDSGPFYNRVAVYATSLNMIAHRPLLGYGFGARTFIEHRQPYFASCCGVSIEWAEICVVPHNEILNLLILLGAVGLLLYVLLLRELWRLLEARRGGADRGLAALAAGLQAGFLVLIVSAQLHDVMYLTAVQMLSFFLIGLIAPAPAVAAARAGAAAGGQGVV